MDESEIRELKVVDLVNSFPVYGRLTKSVNRAAQENSLPFETVGEMLDAGGKQTRKKFQTVEGIGPRAVDQLFNLLRRYVSDNLFVAFEDRRKPIKPSQNHNQNFRRKRKTKRKDQSRYIRWNGEEEKTQGPASLNSNPRDLRIVDIVKSSPTSVRLSNCIDRALVEKTLPFETIGDFLSAEDKAYQKLLSIKNLGQGTADELIQRIKDVIPEIWHTKIVDLVRTSSASARLLHCINQAVQEKKLPFDTLGDYITAGIKARPELLKIKNLGRGTAEELSRIIRLALLGKVTEEPRYEKNLDLIIKELDSKFPGVFVPLIEAYAEAGENEQAKREKLEKAAQNLLQNNSHHADMLQRRFMGGTLQEIGERYGITRERVRQLEAKYKEYTTDIESREWVEKAIRDLISSRSDRNRLPPNEEINRHHPKLAAGLIKNFTSKNYSSLTPALRLEVAKKLGLDREHELLSQTRWSVERVILEVKKLASELGKPDLMPMQVEMGERGRQDLRGAISKYGGQAKVAELAGLKYQGQLVAPDGSRQYWTDERIKAFLYEVAEKNGHPGVMPTQREWREHASNPATVVSGITQVRSDQPRLTWFEASQKYGLRYVKGIHQVTLPFIKSFVKSLGDALYALSPAEIYVLFEQQGITKSYQNRTFDNLVEAVQSGFLPKEEIKKWVEGGKGDLVEALLDPEIQSVEEAFNSVGKKVQRRDHKKKEDNPSDEAYREDVDSQLPLPTSSETLDALQTATNVLIHASSDEEAVQFLVAKAADKLWKRCFLDEDATFVEAKQHQGNTYSEAARNAFIEEYTRCKQLPIPEEYSFRDPNGISRQPKLMQSLIAYRVLTQGRVLNLSGTGTGKTLSAVLASRVIGARLTVVACPNATVEAWRDTILNTFPRSEVITKPPNWKISWGTLSMPRYVVVNHEMFQNRYEGRIKHFIEEQAADLIVIDELHKVKQRTPEQETQRRRLLTGLITDIPDGRPKPRVLGMSATPIINNLQEGKSLVELVTSMTHDEIGSKTSVQNCMKLYQRFMTLGFRMLPKQEISREPKIYPTDATPYLEELLE